MTPRLPDNAGSSLFPLPMQLSLSRLLLRTKQVEIDALQHLSGRVELVDVIGQLIHALQHERGVTSVYLASGGQRFAAERQADVSQTRPIEEALLQLFERQLQPDSGATPRMLSLMAWLWLDLEALSALRSQIDELKPSAHDAVAAFSRLIAGLVELVFHIADSADHPGISRHLVALVHLLQGKEAAGQERAVGAQLFASGLCDEFQQQRIVHLIDAQERSLQVFDEFADPTIRTRWQQLQLTPNVAQLERMRRTLCTARPQSTLDAATSDAWFATTSERITELRKLEQAIVYALKHYCLDEIQNAQRDLQDSEGLLKKLRENPPPHTHAVDRFFTRGAQPDAAPILALSGEGLTRKAEEAERQTVSSLVEMLEAQSARLSSMEVELDAAKRALQDRKIIERAKGALMSRLGMTEEAAFRALQKASMDHNRRLADIAEATLTLPDFLFSQANP
ncbi:MAG TPA: nitrate- and nitrite sensing domain-containing protein, partial [Aquabacterium sp.]|nr:nitrate- and nitrite sensing domain-containing protein [Aquabacterium sp.]